MIFGLFIIVFVTKDKKSVQKAWWLPRLKASTQKIVRIINHTLRRGGFPTNILESEVGKTREREDRLEYFTLIMKELDMGPFEK